MARVTKMTLTPSEPGWLQAIFPDLSGIALLSHGGFKLVYSAMHPTEGQVVLKILIPPCDPEATRREVEATRRVAGRRIPPIYDVGVLPSQFGDCFYFREMRVPGTTLRERLRRRPLDWISVLRLGLHVLESLSAAEDVQIVHRDVKPDNVMVHTNGEFWLLDFGIARHLNLESLTYSGATKGKGTPGYAPPEQYQNRKPDIDGRCDLFALAVTIYESATGKNPFRHLAKDESEIYNRIEVEGLPQLNETEMPDGDFRELVSTMGQTRRNHRPETVREALDWIRPICARHSIT